MAVGQQARRADRVVAFLDEKVHGIGVLGVPLQLRRNGLFGDENGVPNPPQLGIVLMPVRHADSDLTHRRTPGFPV